MAQQELLFLIVKIPDYNSILLMPAFQYCITRTRFVEEDNPQETKPFTYDWIGDSFVFQHPDYRITNTVNEALNQLKKLLNFTKSNSGSYPLVCLRLLFSIDCLIITPNKSNVQTEKALISVENTGYVILRQKKL